MVQIIDYNELIKAQREGINRYYLAQPTYQKKEIPRFIEGEGRSGFTVPGPDYNAGWEQTGQRLYTKDMTEEQFKKSGLESYLNYKVTPESIMNKYFPGWQDMEAQRSQGYNFEMPEMPEMPEITFESIYGMSEDEWKYQQEMKADLAQFEPAWAAREAAITSATEEVDRMIRDQESYGALTGQDLTITDEARSTMIANMFADMYGEEQEQYIDKIIRKYGLSDKYPKAVTRGQAGTFGRDESLALTNRKGVSSTVLTDNEDDLLGAEVVLG